MAYNNGFPVNYSQMYYPQQQQSGVIWVSGEAGAKAYLVAPNTTVTLWDSERQVIYMKSADASGMPSIKVLDYTVREAKAPSEPQNYATREEFEALREEVQALLAARKTPVKAVKKEVEE